MHSDAPDELTALTHGMPATREIFAAILDAWPDHARYLTKSMAVRGDDVRAATEILAQAALVLAKGRLSAIAANYRWTCDRLREEELNFHRTGSYRLKTFAEADREVYSNAAYMEKYVDGLLFSQIAWVNHTASCAFFLNTAPQLLAKGGAFLEIGPGHGLMTYLALRDFGLGSAVAWDLSPVSIEQTRAALSLLGFDRSGFPVDFAVRDIMSVGEGEDVFDLVVLSEVLEHLEDPMAAMRQVARLVRPGGLVFVNVPINSPSPDHLYLMQTEDEARALLRQTGFEIVAESFFATQGSTLERAIRNKISVSACMFARPAA